jgi:hypothetical protein
LARRLTSFVSPHQHLDSPTSMTMATFPWLIRAWW